MNGPAAAASPPATADEPEAPAARPIAVVWCRQVDNEEESPGYTTIPEEFPGQRETVDTVRAVGHLAINVADTHDYWDPDPATSLSYYPNLFLYPAFRGEYTCVGRMFLSKEDRPRLGMKTLVLPTQELLQPEIFGSSVLRWHASMGGLRRPSSAARPLEAGLYDRVGEGFLFHRGSTDPVLLVASDRWESTVHVILEMIQGLPGALTALGAILAFPYFLPQARTDLKALLDRIPLTLAVMRVPKAEASGPRHDRRVQSWESTSLTVRDLTAGELPNVGPKGKDPLPLVLQYVRDRAEPKLLPIRQRVDLVELPRLRATRSESDRQSGRSRRKESWRIGTAMESAALLLQRARGRQLPVSGETAKRAQEYLNASLFEPPVRPSEIGADGPEGSEEGGLTPGAEAVPLPTREDPSLLPPSARSPMLGLAVPNEGAGTVEESELRRATREEVERQLAELRSSSPTGAAPIAAGADAGLLQRIESISTALNALPTQLEGRLTESLHQHQLALAALREELLANAASEEAKLRASFAAALAPEIDRKVRQSVEPALAEALRLESDRAHRATMDEVERAVAEMHERLQSAVEETRSALTSQLDRHLRDAADRELTVREATEGRLKESLLTRFADAEEHLAEAAALTEERLAGQLEQRHQETKAWAMGLQEQAEGRMNAALEQRLAALDEQWAERGQSSAAELKENYAQSVADLQVRFERHVDERIREAEEAERQKYLQLFARLKEELDTSATRRAEVVHATAAVPAAMEATLAQRHKDLQVALDHRLATTEERLHVEQSEAIQRLERLEELLGEKSDALARMEQTLRSEIRDLDHRTQILTDRLIPVVRKAWVRIAEIQRSPSPRPGAPEAPGDGRKELLAESRRLEAEMDKRIAEIRHRVESAISHQGRIWLTLVHHLKELADERMVASIGGSGAGAPAWQESESKGAEEPPVRSAGPVNPRSARPPPPPPASARLAPRKGLRRLPEPEPGA
ncbi:MAG TPA: hypothetical protein VGX00_01335 [Thermoplasmata archaeon]|nr:hypothetical protein [Thermoplasmata archaeon]